MTSILELRNGVLQSYGDVFTPPALAALEALASLNRDRREILAGRIARRGAGGKQRGHCIASGVPEVIWWVCGPYFPSILPGLPVGITWSGIVLKR